ncbi:MAG: diguanylate cyclase, partial [Mycobacteriaceae bacterium]|nr:diguanylate cyclase [Mycobacteriaceae bacterium]
RTGGNEFVVVPAAATDLAEARELAEHLMSRLTDHVAIRGEVLNRTVSIGVATGTPGADSSLDLLRHADDALQSTKGTGAQRIGVISTDVINRRKVRADIELHLPGAIETDALTVLYLPEIDMLTGKIMAVEALARWQPPTRGLWLPTCSSRLPSRSISPVN